MISLSKAIDGRDVTLTAELAAASSAFSKDKQQARLDTLLWLVVLMDAAWLEKPDGWSAELEKRESAAAR